MCPRQPQLKKRTTITATKEKQKEKKKSKKMKKIRQIVNFIKFPLVVRFANSRE
jgi:hypothetical protein